MNRRSLVGVKPWLALILALLGGGSLPGVAAGETAMEAVLVWGTNGAKPADAKLKDLEPGVRDKLRGVFKWKDYFEVERKPIQVSEGGQKRVRMSERCEIEVESLGESTVEVKLFGEGKLVVKRKQKMKAGELLVLAGEDKNDTAWFVVLSLSKGK